MPRPSLPTLAGLSGLRHRNAKARSNGPGPNTEPIPVSAYVVNCGVYVHGKRLAGEWSYEDAVDEVRSRGDGFVWIGLHEPNTAQIQGIADTFGLHELAVEDAVHAHQRPKLERYPDMLFMVFKTVHYVEHDSPEVANELVETGEIMAFLGRDFILTVRHGAHTGLSALRQHLEGDPEQLAMGPSAVLHAISDRIVDSYLAVTDAMQDDVDEMEERVFAPKTAIGADPIYLLKREVLELRRAVQPLSLPLRQLTEGHSQLVPHAVRSYFRDVADHLTEVTERVGGFDELLTTLVDATLAKISLQQNTDMRKITAWAAIISVPTMVAGIYGMNFDVMPELHWRFGYPLVLLVILLACLLLYRILRKNQWL